MTIDLAFGHPLVDRTYFLGDEDLVYEWDEHNLITRSTLVDCGPLVVEIYQDDEDKSPPDPLIFKKQEQAFIVLKK